MTASIKHMGAALLFASAANQNTAAFIPPGFSSRKGLANPKLNIIPGSTTVPRDPNLVQLREPKSQLSCKLFGVDLELLGFDNPFDPKKPMASVTFKDVAGVESAKESLQEIVEFLKDPEKFANMGAEVPKGVLLNGPPGTGKTLLAKAVAGEAGVPFYSKSGSEFVEMYVGLGAKRVRDFFAKAKRSAPCIIFIDEIDALGKKRTGDNPSGGSDERDQTLNQLLTEMDGFEGDTGVIVIAATNRADMLDEALVRPGRFDRKVTVGLPNRGGREGILGVHARGKPLGKDVDFAYIAKRTPGFSGAALKNLLNEAAILAVKRKKKVINMSEINDAIDHLIAGPKKVNSYMPEELKRLVAVHEAGHAIVAYFSPEADKVSRISVIGRENSAGLTWFTPDEKTIDSGLATKQYLKSQMAMALGGRIAERIMYGEDGITTGASNDLQRVTAIAKQMVERFGMSKSLGYLNLEPESIFGKTHSEYLRELVDKEILKIGKEAQEYTEQLLMQKKDKLVKVADVLMEDETIEGDDFRKLMGDNNSTGHQKNGGGLRGLKAEWDAWQNW